MRSLAGAVGALMLAGCLSTPPAEVCERDCEDAGEAGDDGGTADAATDAAVCPTYSVSAEQDGVFTANDKTNNYGMNPIGNIGTGINSTGLFLFDVSDMPEGQRVALRLNLNFAETSDDCTPADACVSCLSIEDSGALVLHFARSDWSEATFTYYDRSIGNPWADEGAGGIGVDRSEPIGTSTHTAGDDKVLLAETEFLAADLDLWIQDGLLSFLVAPGGGSVAVVAMKESGQDGCEALKRAYLEIDICP